MNTQRYAMFLASAIQGLCASCDDSVMRRAIYFAGEAEQHMQELEVKIDTERQAKRDAERVGA